GVGPRDLNVGGVGLARGEEAVLRPDRPFSVSVLGSAAAQAHRARIAELPENPVLSGNRCFQSGHRLASGAEPSGIGKVGGGLLPVAQLGIGPAAAQMNVRLTWLTTDTIEQSAQVEDG